MKHAAVRLALAMTLAACSPPRPAVPTIPPPAAETCAGTQGYAAEFGGRRTFLWRPAWLNLVKTDDNAAALRKRLLAEADRSLEGPAPSVVAKTGVPPSGDKHDYMSWPPYWWESAPGQYVVRDGDHNPEARSAKFDVIAFEEMTSRVSYLALGYYLSGDRRYSQKAVELLDTWFIAPATAMNPNLKFGQMVPGKRPPAVIETVRFMPVVEAIGLLEVSGDLTPEEKATLQTWFSKYVDWMLTEPGPDDRFAENNRALAFDLQLSEYALFAGRADVARETLRKLPEARLAKQIAADGRLPKETQRANGLTYSLFALGLMFQLADLGECVDVDLWSFQGLPALKGDAQGEGKREQSAGIRAAVDFLLPYFGHEETWPYSQSRAPDDIERIRRRFMELLPQATWVTGDPRYLVVAVAYAGRNPGVAGVWWRGPMALPDPARSEASE